MSFRLSILTNHRLYPAKVRRTIARNIRWVLGKVGYAAMRRMRKSMPNRGGAPSPAGGAPHSKLGTLRDFTLYGVDSSAASVVVGAKPLPRTPKVLSLFGKRTIPQVIEQGGKELLVAPGGGGLLTVLASYQRRPFAKPQLEPSLRHARHLMRLRKLTRS